MAVVPSGDN